VGRKMIMLLHRSRLLAWATFLSVLLLGGLAARPAHACACDPDRRWTVEAATYWASGIVIGRVTGLDQSEAIVAVEEVLKGEPLDEVRIDNRYLYGACCDNEVQKPPRRGAPELRFRVGDRVLLYLGFGLPTRQPVMTAAGVLGEGFYRIEGRRLLRVGCLAGTLPSHRRRIAATLAEGGVGKPKKERRPKRLRKCRCGRG